MVRTIEEISTQADTVVGGVDTHSDTHTVAALDGLGRLLGHETFPATRAGYRQLLTWLATFGTIELVGVEGTGSYGAGLVRHLTGQGVLVVEVDRPDRRGRRRHGKSDPIDAIAAARAAQSAVATGLPKTRTGAVEAIRTLRVARSGAIKARTAAMNALRALLITAPDDLREELASLGTAKLIARCARLRPGPDLTEPTQATKVALRRLALRWQALTDEIKAADADLTALVEAAAPALLDRIGVGPEVAAQLLVTAGDNPHRLKSEASFAALCGANPLPASSGRTDRHRLNRGGDRGANSALYRVVIVRMRYHQPTRDYVARRRAQGLSQREIIRCLKRYVARELLPLLREARPATSSTAA